MGSCFTWYTYVLLISGSHGRDCMVVGFTTTMYLCIQCLSPLKMWVWILLMARCTLCDKVCQWLATGRWFSPWYYSSSTKKTYHHDIAKILLKVALNIIRQPVIINSTEFFVHHYMIDWLIYCVLMPLSSIFQLYHGDQF